MKYFIDFEFIEGFKKPLFGKRRHFIDMISVGIACEDGRTYYAISNEYNYKDGSKWVQENIIIPMYSKTVSGDSKNHFSADSFHKHFGLSNKVIASDILKFVNPSSGEDTLNDQQWNTHLNKYNVVASENRPVEFYGYYSDYDWVLFCSLFGTMMDLPTGFPMYCIDLKQTMDEMAKKVPYSYDKELGLQSIKMSEGYPKQYNEHNALADAKWNKQLYDFLQI